MKASLHRGQFLAWIVNSPVSPSPIRRNVSAAANRDDLLRGVTTENRDYVARVLEQAERASDSWEIVHTAFYSPPIVAESMAILSKLADIVAVPWGGYSQAERCRISLGREEAMHGAAEDPTSVLDSVAALKVEGNFLFDPATHRDFLGACLSTGIERKFVGDIIVQGDIGAQILVAPTIVEHLETSLVQVRTVPTNTRLISLHELRVPAPSIKEISSMEASLRLDAIASAGFRISRSKMTDMIKSGDVRVNWRSTGIKPSSDVAQGDVISVSGKGRVEVKAINVTKKGKYAVEMVRYV